MVSKTNKMLLASLAIVFFLSTIMASYSVTDAEPTGPVYIKSDGSIDPPTAPIMNLNNKTYTLSADMNDSIIIQRSDISMDGAGFSIHGPGVFVNYTTGILLQNVTNVTVKNFHLEAFLFGIRVDSSSNMTFVGNNVTNNGDGFHLTNVNNSKFVQNVMIRNQNVTLFYGIVAYNSCSNLFLQNTIAGNGNSGLRTSFTSNDTIIRNNITGTHEFGLRLESAFNDTISGNIIRGCHTGIWAYPSGRNMISNNTIVSNDDAGVRLEYAETMNNQIHNNILRNNTNGILLRQSSDFNSITANSISDNTVGIEISETANNTIYHNNFLSNIQDISEIDSQNTWDNGLEGNYWNSYNGKDNDQDGIGDSPLQINANNTDHYPLMGIFCDFNLKTETENLYCVQVISNSTILNVTIFYWNATTNQYFQNGQAYIRIDLATEPNSTGFGRVTFPKALLNATQYVVLVNMTETPTMTLTDPDSALAIVYFQYNDSAHDAIIVPEFSLLGVIFMILVGSAGLSAYSVRRGREDPSLSTKT